MDDIFKPKDMRKGLFLAGLLSCAVLVQGQNLTIVGNITDGKEPVIGAAIQVEGLNIGTVSDMNGDFRIEAPADAVLSVSYVGYLPLKKKLKKGENRLQLVLQEDIKNMDEVVVTALNIKRNRRSLGYSTQ